MPDSSHFIDTQISKKNIWLKEERAIKNVTKGDITTSVNIWEEIEKQ